jgi:hypothetical protein
MKKLTLLLAISLLGFGCFENILKADDDDNGPPGQKKKDGVPPGLQKKGGLPPGQAKKRAKYGQPEQSVPATPSAPAAPATPSVPPAPASVKAPPPSVPPPTPPTPSTPAPPPVLTAKVPDAPKPPAPDAPKLPAPEVAKPAPKVSKEVMERRVKLDKHVADLDAMGKTPEVRERMMVRMYKRLDVPLSTMEAELKAHPNIGAGGLVAGHYIAKRSKQPVEKILAAREGGKTWGEIAGENKVDLTELNEQMANAKESARVAEREAARK